MTTLQIRYFSIENDPTVVLKIQETRADVHNFRGFAGDPIQKPDGFDTWPAVRDAEYTSMKITLRRRPS